MAIDHSNHVIVIKGEFKGNKGEIIKCRESFLTNLQIPHKYINDSISQKSEVNIKDLNNLKLIDKNKSLYEISSGNYSGVIGKLHQELCTIKIKGINEIKLTPDQFLYLDIKYESKKHQGCIQVNKIVSNKIFGTLYNNNNSIKNIILNKNDKNIIKSHYINKNETTQIGGARISYDYDNIYNDDDEHEHENDDDNENEHDNEHENDDEIEDEIEDENEDEHENENEDEHENVHEHEDDMIEDDGKFSNLENNEYTKAIYKKIKSIITEKLKLNHDVIKYSKVIKYYNFIVDKYTRKVDMISDEIRDLFLANLIFMELNKNNINIYEFYSNYGKQNVDIKIKYFMFLYDNEIINIYEKTLYKNCYKTINFIKDNIKEFEMMVFPPIVSQHSDLVQVSHYHHQVQDLNGFFDSEIDNQILKKIMMINNAELNNQIDLVDRLNEELLELKNKKSRISSKVKTVYYHDFYDYYYAFINDLKNKEKYKNIIKNFVYLDNNDPYLNECRDKFKNYYRLNIYYKNLQVNRKYAELKNNPEKLEKWCKKYFNTINGKCIPSPDTIKDDMFDKDFEYHMGEIRKDQEKRAASSETNLISGFKTLNINPESQVRTNRKTLDRINKALKKLRSNSKVIKQSKRRI